VAMLAAVLGALIPTGARARFGAPAREPLPTET
jgi:hypothetical protein